MITVTNLIKTEETNRVHLELMEMTSRKVRMTVVNNVFLSPTPRRPSAGSWLNLTREIYYCMCLEMGVESDKLWRRFNSNMTNTRTIDSILFV